MNVTIFEEHSSVLPELWRRGASDRTLVYLDAHLDLQPISRPRLARLQSCASTEQVRALEKPHHLLPDRGYAYSLEDWLYPAHRLRLYRRLIWVAPPHVAIGPSAEVIAHLQQMDGVTPAEIASFRALPGGGFTGMLAGVEITICNHRELQGLALSGEVVIDVDADYFIEVPGDRPWVHPRTVFEALERISGLAEAVTISRSVGSGFSPLRYRYVADYLAALWQRREADAVHYDRLFDADQELRRGGSSAVADALDQELARFPECAATWYLRSQVDPGHEDSIKHREQAARLCESYRTDLVRCMCAYPQRRLPLDRAALRELQRRVIEEPLTPERRALAQAALGTICCVVGRLDKAIELYRQSGRHLDGHPGLALEIGKALVAAGHADSAVGYLRAALADDKSRTAALVCLAQIYRDRGDVQQSLECATAALEAAPAWNEVMLLRDGILRRVEG